MRTISGGVWARTAIAVIMMPKAMVAAMRLRREFVMGCPLSAKTGTISGRRCRSPSSRQYLMLLITIYSVDIVKFQVNPGFHPFQQDFAS